MRALRVVGLTEDGEVVLEDPVRLERFRVPADERLRAAARGDLSRLGQIAIELESQLRPREIQARIRAGASVEQVAEAAGVPEQKIERFAYPVLLERFRTAENAQRAHPVRADGPDSRTLAEVVEHTFGLRGQAYEGARWDSWKGEDGRWVVALSWRAGRSDNRAHWTFQPGAHGGTVSALDEHASDLVEGLPARPLRTVGAVVDMARPEEEPPAPSPVEQWRAAASDSYRERLPHVPEPARGGGERGTTRTAPEPWRPAPPRREPAVPEQVRPAAEYAEPARVEPPRPEPARAEPARHEPVRPERAAPEPAVPAQVRSEPTPQPAAESAPQPTPVPGTALPVAPASTGSDHGAPPVPRPEADRAPAVPDAVAPAEPAAPVEPVPVPEPTAPEPTVPETAATAAAPEPEGPATPEPATPSIPERATPEPAAETPAPEPAATSIPDPTPAAADPAPADPAPPAAAETPAAETPAAEAPAAEAPEPPAAGRRTKKGKPVMPSWDEVLLGVRGPR